MKMSISELKSSDWVTHLIGTSHYTTKIPFKSKSFSLTMKNGNIVFFPEELIENPYEYSLKYDEDWLDVLKYGEGYQKPDFSIDELRQENNAVIQRLINKNKSLQSREIVDGVINRLDEFKAERKKGFSRGYLFSASYVGLLLIFHFICHSIKGRVEFNKERSLQLIKPGQLNRQSRRINKKKRQYSLAGVEWANGDEMKSSLIIGQNPKYRQEIYLDLIEQSISKGDKVVALDHDNKLVPYHYKKDRDVILNPYDARTNAWSLLTDVRNKDDIRQIASVLIPTTKDPVGERLRWFARRWFTIKATEMLTNDEYDNSLLANRICNVDVQALAHHLMQRDDLELDVKDPSKALTAAKFIIEDLQQYIGTMTSQATEGDRFSISEWIQNTEAGVMYISNYSETHDPLETLMATQLDIVLKAVMTSKPRSSDARIWILMDEPQMPLWNSIINPHLSNIAEFGGCFVFGLRSMYDVIAAYDSPAVGRSVVADYQQYCGTCLCFEKPTEDIKAWISHNFGHVASEEIKADFNEDGFGDFDVLDGYLKFPNSKDISKIKLEHKDRPTVADAYVAANALNSNILQDASDLNRLTSSNDNESKSEETKSSNAPQSNLIENSNDDDDDSSSGMI
jgi:hypothetical protein